MIKRSGYDLVERMKGIAGRHKATVAQAALAWLLGKPHVTSILLGASKVSQLDDNLGSLNVVLTTPEMNELDRLTAPGATYPGRFQEKTLDQPAGRCAKG
jgi:aryl-alcohol dehydrogenase-like predicted oxidoreductase